TAAANNADKLAGANRQRDVVEDGQWTTINRIGLAQISDIEIGGMCHNYFLQMYSRLMRIAAPVQQAVLDACSPGVDEHASKTDNDHAEHDQIEAESYPATHQSEADALLSA